MSVIVELNKIPQNIIKQLNNDLIVKPVSKETKMYKGLNIPVKKIVVECFDTFKIKKDSESTKTPTEVACIPYSYYYHNMEHSVPSVALSSHDTAVMDFQGELLERQKEVRKQTLEILNRTKSIILSLHTGFGKTIFTLYLLSKIKLKTIVLCHRRIIIDQWISSIKKYLPNTTVSVLGTKDEDVESDIMIANVINIPKKDRIFYCRYGAVVVDEIHTVCTESFSKSLLYLFPKYLIGLSATPVRSDGLDRILEIFVGPEIIIRNMHKHFNVYKLNTNFTPDVKTQVTGSLDWNSVLESQAKDADRNRLIVDLCRYFINRNILVLVKRKDHANLLMDMLKENGESVDVFMGDSKMCNYDCRILIATYSKGGVGFDHPKLNMLIGAADVQESFMQYLGRIFRRDDVSPVYIDLVDNMSTLKTHSTSRCNICKDIGGIVKKFEKYFPYFYEMINLLK